MGEAAYAGTLAPPGEPATTWFNAHPPPKVPVTGGPSSVALEKSESARRSTLAPRSRRLRNTAPAPRTAHDTAYGAACQRCEIALTQAAIAGGVELAQLSGWAESQRLGDRRGPTGQIGAQAVDACR